MFEVTYAPNVVQRRDNWSRETVRSLRRKVGNLKAQIRVRDLSIKERERVINVWKRSADYWRRKHTDGFGEMSAEQYRMTQRMAELTSDLAAERARREALEVAPTRSSGRTRCRIRATGPA